MKCKKFGIHIKVKNFDKSYKFYKYLGFKEIFAYGPKKFTEKLPKSINPAPEKYRGVTFEIGNALLEIGEDHIAVKKEVFRETVKSSKVSAMIDVDSIDKLIAQCKKCEIEIAVPPKTFPWGTREVVIKDPDGFVLVFRENV